MKKHYSDLEVEEGLRASFVSLEAPQLDSQFHSRMTTRLSLERPRRQASLRQLILRSYWAAALAASFAIVALLPWKPELVSGPLLVAFCILIVFLCVPSLLLRRLGWAALLIDTLAESGSDRP